MIGSQMVGGLAARAAGALVGRSLPPTRGRQAPSEPAPTRSRPIPPKPYRDERTDGAPAERRPAGGESNRFAKVPSGGGRKRASSSEPTRPVFTDRNELEKSVGASSAVKVERRLKAAAKAFDAERFDEALPALRGLAADLPHSSQIRELYGLALYRIGRWADAARELEAFATMTDSTEQHPVLADCYRALRRWADVDRLWDELRNASPTAELVNEGRIVTAGSLADRKRLPEAVAMLEQGFKAPAKPKPHQLRRMYALADLYERSGALGEARDLFRRVAAFDPDFFDVVDRVRALG